MLYGFLHNSPLDHTDALGTRWEYDSEGLHWNGSKIDYVVEPQADGSLVFRAKPGHPGTFDEAQARAHFLSAIRDPEEFKKIRGVVRDAYNQFSDKGTISQCGINLRRARFALRALGIVAMGLALSPTDAAAAGRLKQALDRVDASLSQGDTPDENDANDILIAVKDIYGQDGLALWYWNSILNGTE